MLIPMASQALGPDASSGQTVSQCLAAMLWGHKPLPSGSTASGPWHHSHTKHHVSRAPGLDSPSVSERPPTEPEQPTTSLGTALTRLVLLAVIPMLLVTGALVWNLLAEQRSALESSIYQQARSLRLELEGQADHWRTTAENLGRAYSGRDDWEQLYAQASRIVSGKDGVRVALIRRDGTRIFDTTYAYGSPTPPAFTPEEVFPLAGKPPGPPAPGVDGSRNDDTERWRELFDQGVSHFSSLFIDSIDMQPALAYRVPVDSPSGERFAVSVKFPPSSINAALRGADLADDGFVGVVDAAGTFIARNQRNEQIEQAVGRPSSDALLLSALSQRDEVIASTSEDGETVILATSYSPQTGWLLGMGVPTRAAMQGIERSLMLWSITGAGLLAILVLLSRRTWRAIGIPLQVLARNASAFERGEALVVPSSRIKEVREAGRAWELAIEADLGRRAQERLRLAAEARRAEIEQANRENDKVLAALGHELRNPLAAISNGVEVIGASAPPDPGLTAMIAVLKRQTGHLGRLLDDMFDLARATFGKLEIRRAPVDLHALTRQTLAAYDPRRGKIAAIELVGSSVWVEGDQTRLDQVIRNLVDNAIKSTMPQGHIVVQVQAEGDQAILQVTDDGIGIAPELIERVFVPFVQDEQKLDRTRGGLGLGLALVRQIIELHGGSASLASEGRGRGASIRVSMDRIDPPQRREPRPQPATITEALDVLVVEDQQDLRESLTVLLEIMGLTVRDAASGADALALLSTWQPAVALVDIGLPDIDGFDLARRIRANGDFADIQLIAMTGFSENTHRAEALDAGFDAYLVKPVSRAKLAATLAELRNRSEQSSGG